MKEYPKEWTRSLVIPLPKKGNLKQCQNRTISLLLIPARSCSELTYSRSRPRNCKQKSEQVSDLAGAKQSRSSVVESLKRNTNKISTIHSTTMQAFDRSAEASAQRKDWFKSAGHRTMYNTVQCTTPYNRMEPGVLRLGTVVLVISTCQLHSTSLTQSPLTVSDV